MNRNRNYNRNNRNRNYKNKYNYYISYYDPHPEVARLSDEYLYIISQNTGSRINPGAYNPNKGKGCFIINCYATFECGDCRKSWTSNQVTVELWFKNGKKQFDVRMYGQQCKKCDGEYIKPFIIGLRQVIETCIYVLTHPSEKGKSNTNKNSNTNFNSAHDEQRCQKCRIVGHPCWQ